MKNLFINLLFKFLTLDSIAKVSAKCVVWLLEYARNKSDEHWDKAKAVINQINRWTGLFVQVYEDDKLTPEEEKQIADAISNLTTQEKIDQILNKIADQSK